MKILHIIGDLGVGGCEKQLLELCRRLNARGHDTTVLWYSHTPDELSAEFAAAGTHVLFTDKFAQPLWRFFRRLRMLIATEKPDVIHTWMYSANFWGRWAALAAGCRKIVVSYRNEVRAPDRMMRLTEYILRRRTVLLANSAAVAESLHRYYGCRPEHITVYYNGIAPPRLPASEQRCALRQKLGLPTDKKIIMMVARQHPQKNYPMFVRTAATVCAQRQDTMFVAVGRGDMMDELQGLVKQYGLEGRAVFVGQQHNVSEWLLCADVFCFTTDYEGFSNALLEAMACGLPVVSTEHPGVNELICDNSVGKTVACNDHRAMAGEIQKLLVDPDAAALLGQAARAHIIAQFSYDRLISETLNTYAAARCRHEARN